MFDMNIKDGVRWNTSNAYLRNNKEKKLTVITDTFVNRIIFSGNRAIGVEVVQRGEVKTFYAEKEVILSAGAINSVQLLQLSGVGDAEHLEKLGIKVVVDDARIGHNLQDHIEVYMQYKCNQPITLSSYGSFLKNPIKKTGAGIEWFLRGTGICIIVNQRCFQPF